MIRSLIIIVAMAIGFAVGLLFLNGCTDDGRSTQVLFDSGYSDITITGYQWYGCGDGDTYTTGFRAKNPAGRMVSGVVCCGILKSCTVRF